LKEVGRRWRPITKKAISRGIRETVWEGRLESLPGRPRVVLDGAHNDSGARALAAYVKSNLPSPVTLVFGIMKDKSIRRVARRLFPLARTIILTSAAMARAASPELVFSLAPNQKKGIFLEPDSKKALERALEMTPPRGSVLVTGSLFLVGEVKKHFSPWKKT